MRGLALEGGGARGAYHIGAVKALYEKGYEFDGFVGTSIGAINAALLAQGSFESALELWENITMEQLFEEDEQKILQLADFAALSKDKKLPPAIRKTLLNISKNGGINTEKMRAFIGSYLNEEKIRQNGKDFGLVTLSLNERKPYELMLPDIPDGQLLNYIMASASFPAFRPETIGENKFLDGGVYDNCPYNLLLEKGYDEIIAVRTNAIGIFRKVKNMGKVKIISARESLGPVMLFSPQRSAANIMLGYYDALRFCENLAGTQYYIRMDNPVNFDALMLSVNNDIILEAGKILSIPEMPAKRMFFEKIIPQLGGYFRLEKNFAYEDFTVALLELIAEHKKAPRFNVYGFGELCNLANELPETDEKRPLLPLMLKTDKQKLAAKIIGEKVIRGVKTPGLAQHRT
jgi:NTE family protein